MSSVILPPVYSPTVTTYSINHLSRSPAPQPLTSTLSTSSVSVLHSASWVIAERKALVVPFKYPQRLPDGLAARILYKYESSMQIFPAAAALPPLLHLPCRPLGHPASSSSSHEATAPIISYHGDGRLRWDPLRAPQLSRSPRVCHVIITMRVKLAGATMSEDILCRPPADAS